MHLRARERRCDLGVFSPNTVEDISLCCMKCTWSGLCVGRDGCMRFRKRLKRHLRRVLPRKMLFLIQA